MNKPWLRWSRRDFQWMMLPLLALNFLAFWVVLPIAPSGAARAAVGLVIAASSLVLVYVTFSCATAHDRRNSSR